MHRAAVEAESALVAEAQGVAMIIRVTHANPANRAGRTHN
jgi:hypothetical protein